MKKILLAALTLLSLQTIANHKGEKHKEETKATKKFSITVSNKYGTHLEVKLNGKSWMKAIEPWASKTYKRKEFNALALRRVTQTAKDGQKAEKRYTNISHNLKLSKKKEQKFWVYSKSVSDTAPKEGEMHTLRIER